MIHLFQQLVKEALMKKLMKIIGVIVSVAAAAAAALVIKGFTESKKPSAREDYYSYFAA